MSQNLKFSREVSINNDAVSACEFHPWKTFTFQTKKPENWTRHAKHGRGEAKKN